MTKILKRRFIVFTMVALSCLLVFIVIAINGINGWMLNQQSNAMIQTLVDANGAFHKMNFNKRPPFAPPLNMDRMQASRFFIVEVNSNNEIDYINIDQIASVDKQQASDYAIKVVNKGSNKGMIDSYKFIIKNNSDHQLIFFMDISDQRNNFFSVLYVTLSIALLCWLVLLYIVIYLSGKVIRPVLEGIEKQKQFITNAGHETKTPLAIIQSNNETMALIYGENKYNKNIANQTKRLNILMSNLLTLAKLDENIALPKEKVNLSLLTNELLKTFSDSALGLSIQLIVSIEEDITMDIHKESYRQLVTLLMDNAIKYTPENGTIYFNLIKKNKHIILIEENTCALVHEKDPERLFERFYRQDNARTQNKTSYGYGIGLSAARAICGNFGGSLIADYPNDDMIRFTATL